MSLRRRGALEAYNAVARLTSARLRTSLARLGTKMRGLRRTAQIVTAADRALVEMDDLLRAAQRQAGGPVRSGAGEDATTTDETIRTELQSTIDAANRIAHSARFGRRSLFDGSIVLTVGDQKLALPAIGIRPIESDDDPARRIELARHDLAAERKRLDRFARTAIDVELKVLSVRLGIVSAAESAVRDTELGRPTAAASHVDTLRLAAGRALGLLGETTGSILDVTA
jgi:hypothetical protein